MNALQFIVALCGVAGSIAQIVVIVRFAIDTSAENLISVAVCFLVCVGIEMFNGALEWFEKTLNRSKLDSRSKAN